MIARPDERIDFDAVSRALPSRPCEACIHLSVYGEPVDTDILLCNNMLDTQPTWETYIPWTTHQFVNRVKTSEAWAVGVRVRLGPDVSLGLRMKAPVILVKCD